VANFSTKTLSYWALPRFSLRFFQVWRRNYLVWWKLAIPSILGNLADPMILMLGLGYGLGSLLPLDTPALGGVSYMAFLAAGAVCFSTMNSATFEVLYSGYSRMEVQRTWDAILNAPVSLDDLLLAELLWAASKAFLSGVSILIVAWVMGLTPSPLSMSLGIEPVMQSAMQPSAPNPLLALWALPLVFLIGLAFSGIGLIVTSLAKSYDFFMYYFTLFITPMGLLSGVFFPIEQLPQAFQTLSAFLPLPHAVQLVRPLLFGQMPHDILLHVAALAAYAAFGFYIALALTRRRMLK